MTLSAESLALIDKEVAKYPADQKQSAVMSALRIAQLEKGWLATETIEFVAAYLGMPNIAAYEVATFYSMFQLEPVGRHNVAICTNISCWLNGAEDLVRHCEKKLGVKLGESTPDGRVYLKREEECIAACVCAPAMTVNGHYHEHLTADKVDEILDGLK